MTRWFRHYVGMMRDEKLVRAAVQSKQPVERVMWVWGAILESAAEINDNGRYELDLGEAGYFLRCDPAELAGILASLEGLGRLAGGMVARWGDRQYSSDAAAERQRRYRERKSHAGTGDDDHSRNGDADGDVTPPSRDGPVTPQDTRDREQKTESKYPAPPAESPGARDAFSELLETFPRNQKCSESRAEAAWRATKAKDRDAILAAARRYALWFAEDNEARGRTADAGRRFSPYLATWIESGDWKKPLVLKADVGKPSPDLVVLRQGEPDFLAVQRHRGKPLYVGTSGAVTVTKAELSAALAESVH